MNCGAISLQHVHGGHGGNLSLTKARKLCKTNRDGTTPHNLMDALVTLGYKNVRLKRKVRWSELKRWVEAGNDVIVDWWSDLYANGAPTLPDGHYSVVKKVTASEIVLFDPEPEEEITLSKEFFVSRWHDYEYDSEGKRDDLIRCAVIAKYRKPKTK